MCFSNDHLLGTILKVFIADVNRYRPFAFASNLQAGYLLQFTLYISTLSNVEGEYCKFAMALSSVIVILTSNLVEQYERFCPDLSFTKVEICK